MKFQNDRGGRIILQNIKRPAKDEWGSGLDAMQAAMELEKTVNQALLDLHKVADKHSDFMVSNWNSDRRLCDINYVNNNNLTSCFLSIDV